MSSEACSTSSKPEVTTPRYEAQPEMVELMSYIKGKVETLQKMFDERTQSYWEAKSQMDQLEAAAKRLKDHWVHRSSDLPDEVEIRKDGKLVEVRRAPE